MAYEIKNKKGESWTIDADEMQQDGKNYHFFYDGELIFEVFDWEMDYIDHNYQYKQEEKEKEISWQKIFIFILGILVGYFILK